jgi:deazaflavin-dependent oxidoreductase (nitroreductase family)
MIMYWFANNLFNPILKTILRSPFRFLLPENWVILTYTGRKTHKKRSLIFHVAQYKDEFIVVPGCFGELPNWWRNFRKESKVDLLYRGKSMECLARVIDRHDETVAVPRLAEYVRHFHADRVGITAETTEEMFNELVTVAAKTYPIVTIRPHSSISGS